MESRDLADFLCLTFQILYHSRDCDNGSYTYSIAMFRINGMLIVFRCETYAQRLNLSYSDFNIVTTKLGRFAMMKEEKGYKIACTLYIC